jgi:hypothetical protein
MSKERRENRRTSIRALGLVLLALGIPLSIRALLLMYDTATTTQQWMLREFAAGLCLTGWGIAVLLPSKWWRPGVVLSALGTMGIVTIVAILCQGMPA